MTIYDQFSGPVKNVDVGYLADVFGAAYNEQGRKYCLLHQVKPHRQTATPAATPASCCTSSSHIAQL